MKTLQIVLAAEGEIRAITIEPETTVSDILLVLNLPGYLMTKGPNDPFFTETEAIFDQVGDGEMIFVCTNACAEP